MDAGYTKIHRAVCFPAHDSIKPGADMRLRLPLQSIALGHPVFRAFRGPIAVCRIWLKITSGNHYFRPSSRSPWACRRVGRKISFAQYREVIT